MADFLKGTIDVPVIGKAPKWAVFGIGGIAVVYIGYRWWQASSQPAYVPEDPGFADDGTIPPLDSGGISSGEGGIPPTSGGGQPPTQSDYGFTGTHNDQWSQYATIQLTQSAQWEYTEIVTALGNYLARRPLTKAQVQIVQAAIAVAGYPPEGTYTVITQGADTPHIVAPGGLHVSSTGQTWITVRWEAVSGADDYNVYANGTYKEHGGNDLVSKVEGLSPDTAYTISVSAVNGSGLEGPKASVSTRTDDKPEPEPEHHDSPKPSGGHRTWRISSRYDTLSELVAAYNRHYHTHFSWRQIWDYNLAHRPSSTVRTLKKRGPNKVYHGSAFWFPK